MFPKYRMVSYLLLAVTMLMLVGWAAAIVTNQSATVVVSSAIAAIVLLFVEMWWLKRYQRAVMQKLHDDLQELVKRSQSQPPGEQKDGSLK